MMDHCFTCSGILILASVLCIWPPMVSTFNLDLSTKVVYRMRMPGQWFGFSVALHKQKDNGWILVGAPKAQTNQDGVAQGGSVYKCSPNGPNTCRPVPFDLKGSGYKIQNGKEVHTENKSHQWFGATVSSGGPDLPVVACAPRYIYFSKSRREPTGTCYVAQPDLNRFDEYAPCRTSQWGYHRQGWCQAGMSAAISKKGERVYIGAPGSWQWQGQIFSQTLLYDSKAQALKEGPGSLDVTYLGFSTAVGEFSNDNVDDVVVGRPRGSNLTGEVLVFDYLLKKLHNFSGEQIGSYFGYSIAVADINGDKLDDIVVGAPFYSDFEAKYDSYEAGQVHFIYQKPDGFERSKIDGKHTKGRFGLSLSSMGDVNRDGYADIVIGAPYEGDDGQGTVYVFQGSQNGIVEKPSQVIHAKEISRSLRTFGFSVSGGIDLDSNGYSDLLIGSYSSDTAIYLRAKPIITITSEISVSPKQIHLEDKLCKLRDNTKVSCLTVTVCFNSSGSSNYQNIYASYELVLDEKSDLPRLFFMDIESERETRINVPIRLDKEKLLCDKKKVYVTNSIYDKLSPIVVKVQPSLISNQRGKRQAVYLPPTIDQNVESTVRKEITIQKKCGDDQVCIPDLQMEVTRNLEKYEFSSKGRRKKISFTVEITNKFESAFNARFFFNMSDLVYFDKVEGKRRTDCQIPYGDATLMECFLGNPFKRMEKVKFEITMTPKEITRKASDFEFSFSVNSTNPERNATIKDNDYVITIPVQVDANLTVDGFSYPQVVTYNVSTYTRIKEQAYESHLGPEIVHAYQIINRGESNIRKAEVVILWPSTTLSGKPILYITRPPITSKNVVCRRIVVDPLQLKLQLVRSRLEKIVFPSVLKEIQRDEAGHGHRSKRQIVRFNETAYESEMECDNALCIVIHCTITNLRAENEALIAVAGRLWVSTVTDLDLSRVGVQSKIVARVTELPFQVNPGYLGYEYKEIATEIDSIEEPPVRRPIPWWIIAVALCVGLIILIILIIVLWKCGFFQRKKYVEERNVKRGKNGYHSPQADDAYL